MESSYRSQSPFIPDGISSSCTTFLTNLNNDAGLAGCIAPLVAATSKYGPTASHKTTPTVAGVSSDLDNLCAPSTTTACPQPLIRSNLGDFLAACNPELTSDPNDDVIRTYDVLYALIPLQEAVCSKDDNGTYCATETTPPGSDGSANVAPRGLTPAEISEYLASPATGLSKRAAGDQVAFVPNASTIANTNLLFLFLNGDMSSDKLCTTCTKNVLTAYINFESAIPYGPGLSQSVLLGGQIQLWSDVSQTCGTNFLGGAVEAAGGLGTNSPFGSASGGARSAGYVGASAVVAAGLSAVGFALAL
jgi:hypothetical protein